MSSENTVKDNRNSSSGNTPFNSISFMIESALRQQINTADVVIVVAVENGYVTVKQLVGQVDSFNNVIAPVEQFKLPYSRIQGGIAALIIDPIPGDIGLAIYTKRDSSNVGVGTSSTVQPGSFRAFDMANGFYIGGFLNQAPEVFLELTQSEEAILTAPASVTVNTAEANINAETMITITTANAIVNSPLTTFTGNVAIGGGLAVAGVTTNADGGAFEIEGGLQNTGGTVSSNGIVLDTHTHNAPSGGGTTSGPN